MDSKALKEKGSFFESKFKEITFPRVAKQLY